MDNNAEFVLDLSLFSNGKLIKEDIKEQLFAKTVLKLKIYARHV
jgi:hypothetical protein